MIEQVGHSTPYDAKGLTNLLLDWAESEKIEVTPMKLQKLLYFCHADFFRITGRALIKQDFEAWEFGPVLPGVYADFREFSKTPINSRAFLFDPISATKKLATVRLRECDGEILRSVFDFYKCLSATALSDLSHSENGPWDMARRSFQEGRNTDRRIYNELIHIFYARRRAAD